MAPRELFLSFEGPDQLVRPDRCEARPLLEVLLAFVQLMEKIGAHESALDDEPPFVVLLKELRAGSIRHVLGFLSRYESQTVAAARRAGIDAARLAPQYLERPEVGPQGVRVRVKKLSGALSRLPPDVTAHLRGAVEAPLSMLAEAPPAATVRSVEQFRARILKAGGLTPRVQLKVAGEARPITLDAPSHLVKLAGGALYAEVDVTAQIERTEDERILHGGLIDLRLLEAGDPVAAIDRWYALSGKPWEKVMHIERGLGRGNS